MDLIVGGTYKQIFLKSKYDMFFEKIMWLYPYIFSRFYKRLRIYSCNDICAI